MSDSEAVEVVHQMVAERNDPGAARRAFWREVAVYPLTLVCAAAYALLMAVAQ